MKVNISELQLTISTLLEKLKENKGNEIDLEHDYFWSLSSEDIFNIDENPKERGLGQLSFDLELIEKLKVENFEYALGYHLEYISNILRALGIENLHAFQ